MTNVRIPLKSRANLGTSFVMNQWVYCIFTRKITGRQGVILKNTWIAGVDEAGRGPLAGPVISAAVILNPDHPIEGLTDSKKLTEKRREMLYEQIMEHSIACAVGRSDVEEIDAINILQATMRAMRRAIEALPVQPAKILIDGDRCPDAPFDMQALIGGDATEACISAASIIAKVTRDREMLEIDEMYPGYGFAQHKGYATRAHYAALAQLGASPIHRQTFRLTAKAE